MHRPKGDALGLDLISNSVGQSAVDSHLHEMVVDWGADGSDKLVEGNLDQAKVKLWLIVKRHEVFNMQNI